MMLFSKRLGPSQLNTIAYPVIERHLGQILFRTMNSAMYFSTDSAVSSATDSISMSKLVQQRKNLIRKRSDRIKQSREVQQYLDGVQENLKT